MSKPFKPMLAVAGDLDTCRWPKIISPKYDGVRAIVRDGVVLSRSLKPIPNPDVQRRFGHLEGADGELIVGSPTAEDVYTKTVSVCMSDQSDLDPSHIRFVIFDDCRDPIDRYASRLEGARAAFCGDGVVVLPATLVQSQQDALAAFERYTEAGYEGAMLRCPDAPYKYGRSTVKEQGLLKLKTFVDAEAVVTGYQELMHNENDHIATTQAGEAAGLRKRSTRAEGLVPAGVLGALQCRTAEGVEFGVGSGFTAADRQVLWQQRDNLIGKLVKYRYQPAGQKEAPRFPVFLGWRSELDL